MKPARAAIVVAAFLAAVLAYAATFLLSHQVLYRRLLVPRLAEFHEVPFWWWFLVASPVLVVAFACGLLARNGHHLLVSGFTCLVGWMLYGTWMMKSGLKSGAIAGFAKVEGGTSSLLSLGLAAAVAAIVVSAVGHLLRNRSSS